MKQEVLHYLHDFGIPHRHGQEMIRKAQQYFGWRLRQTGPVERAVEWVLQGANAYDAMHSGRIEASQQNKKKLAQGLSQILGVSPTHAKYIIKYVEDKYHTKIDPRINLNDAMTFILHRYNPSDFLQVASTNPDYYQFMLQFSPGNVPKGMTQQQIRSLHTIKYKDYKHRKKQTQEKLTECNICLEELKPEDEIIELDGCPHIFHEACAKTWFRINKTCPICKKQVK